MPARQRDPRGECGTFRYVDIASINRETKQIEDAKELACEEAPSRARKDIRVNDLLVSTVRPNLNAVAQVTAELDGQIASTGFAVLRSDPKRIHPRYLFFRVITDAFISDMVAQAKGAGYPAVSDRIVSNHKLPLPPLPEQHRIVEILDQADALRRQRREADELSKRILPALFQEMFGDPNRNDRNWPTNDFEATFEDVSRLGNKIPRSEYLHEGDISVIDQGQEEVAGFWNNQSDKYRGNLPVILFGDHTRIFKLIEHPFCIGADGVRLLNPRKMNPHFAYSMLSMLEIPSRGYSRHFKELKGLSYINPPVDLQKRFGKALVQMRKTTQTASTSAATLETLFQTLLQRTFDGSLTAKWREAQGKELLQEMENHSKR